MIALILAAFLAGAIFGIWLVAWMTAKGWTIYVRRGHIVEFTKQRDGSKT